MKKSLFARTLGAALTLTLAAPLCSWAGPISNTTPTAATENDPVKLASQTMTAAEFNKLFSPFNNRLTSASVDGIVGTPTFGFRNSPISGNIYSQVFEGRPGSAADGLYAYAYQAMSSPIATTNKPTNFDGISFNFNSTPVGTTFKGDKAFSYLVEGPIGDLGAPSLTNNMLAVPAAISWRVINDADTNTQHGSLTFDYNPALKPSQTSATVVLMTKEKPTTELINLRSSYAAASDTAVYVTSPGELIPNPVPEPTTFLAWAGVIGTLAVARRIRSRRAGA